MQLHRLVRAILLSGRAGGATRDDIARAALRLLRVTAPADPWDNPTTWPTWRQLLPHVLTVTSRNPESADKDVAWLLDRAASYLHTQGSPRLARPLFERAFDLYQRLGDEDHLNSLASANNLANNLHAVGEHERARQLHEDTLTRYRRVLGEDHPHTLTTAHNLSNDLHAVDEYQRARQLDEDTLTRRRQILGEDHPETLASANNLANGLHAVGEHQQARQLHEDT